MRALRFRVKTMPSAKPFVRWFPSVVACLIMIGAASRCPAQEVQPASFEAQMAPGIAALKSGDLDNAEQIFANALRQGIKHPLVYHNLGVIAQMRGQHMEAVQNFRKALALEPASGPSRLLLGASLLALGKNIEAKQELLRAVRLMPQQPEAYLQLAKAFEATGNPIAAAQQLQKLVELAPQEPEYAYQMGKRWMKLSGWSYHQIARISPTSARLQQGLGREYADQGKYDLARAAFQRAVNADPKLAEVHLAMAEILLKEGKYNQALAEITLEQKLVPECKAAGEVRAEIEKALAGSAP